MTITEHKRLVIDYLNDLAKEIDKDPSVICMPAILRSAARIVEKYDCIPAASSQNKEKS